MVRYFKNKKGAFYILVAILCIANLVLGVELIRKITYRKAALTIKEKQIEQEAVTAFSNRSITIKTKSTDNKGMVKTIKQNEIFLEILASSNSYMSVALNQNYKNAGINNRFNSIFSKTFEIFNPKNYLKKQIPAIFTLADNEIVYKNPKEKLNPDENLIYEDIIFVEDPSENYEGKVVQSKEDLISSEKPQGIKIDDKNPYIMIYHTHATESYYPIKTNNYHTDKRQDNVISIGEIMASSLQQKGHKVKHVDIYHDVPSYNKSYANSLETIKSELNKNKSLKFLFDIHRNGFDENKISAANMQKLRDSAKIKVNGKDVAKFFFVIGPDNPNKEELLKFTRYIRDEANKMYPGICTGITIKPYGKYNQYLTDYSTLIEVGSNLNTMDEAKESSKLIAEILDKVISDLKEE